MRTLIGLHEIALPDPEDSRRLVAERTRPSGADSPCAGDRRRSKQRVVLARLGDDVLHAAAASGERRWAPAARPSASRPRTGAAPSGTAGDGRSELSTAMTTV